ncbi:MAG: SurA N-terminal domain-containing protein [Candidatus Saccharibacteria bacterium]
MAKTSHTTKSTDLPVGKVVKLKRKKNVLNAHVSTDMVNQLAPRADNELTLGKVAAFSLAAAFAITSITGLGIYFLAWQNPLSGAVSAAVPFPAGYIDGHMLSYHDYYKNVSMQKTYNKTLAKNGQQLIPDTNINMQAIASLEKNALISTWANEHNIAVSSAETDSAMQLAFASQGGEKKFLHNMKVQYGISRRDFVKSTRQSLLQQKVETAMIADSTMHQSLVKHVNEVLLQANSGKDFDSLASQYSQHPTRLMIGDEALVSLSSLPVKVGNYVSALKDGAVGSQSIQDKGNYYIVKRVDTDNGVQARIIVLQPKSALQWVAEHTASAKVSLWLNQVN